MKLYFVQPVLSILLMLGFVLGLSSCYKKECSAEGSRLYLPAAFTEVECGDQHLLSIYQADTFAVMVSGCLDDINDLKVETNGQRLKIHYDSYKNYHRSLSIAISMPALAGAFLSGQSRASITGFNDTTARLFNLSGQSNCTFIGNVSMAGITLSGQSDFSTWGVLQGLEADISGQSHLNGYGMLLNRYCSLRVSGQSKAQVQASGTLIVDASGQSKVYFRGNPVNRQFHSSGQSKIIQE